jgi:hypothetical protein
MDDMVTKRPDVKSQQCPSARGYTIWLIGNELCFGILTLHLKWTGPLTYACGQFEAHDQINISG